MLPKCGINDVATQLGCFPNNPIGFVQQFYGVGLGFVAGVALLALIYGGYIVMTSRGDPRRVNDGKSWIYYSIAGLMLAIFGYVFIQTVLVDILHVPGFS